MLRTVATLTGRGSPYMEVHEECDMVSVGYREGQTVLVTELNDGGQKPEGRVMVEKVGQ